MTREVIVSAMSWEAEDLISVTFCARPGEPLPTWEPGAHVDFITPEGAVAQYSLCGPTGRPTWRIGVLLQRNGRGVSRYVHERLRPGHGALVRGPRNHFRLVAARSYLFIAGGIGITPLLPMIRAVERRRCEWTLVYTGRSASTMGFLTELKKFGSRVQLFPKDSAGRAPLAAIIGEVDRETAIYTCGPEPLISDVCAFAESRGIDTYVERFAPAQPELGAMPSKGEFVVTLARTGITCTVPPDRSILDVLLEKGVSVPSSCRQGVCGSCETRVLAGHIDHRDSILSDAERERQDTMMVCVSRSAGPSLTLDL